MSSFFGEVMRNILLVLLSLLVLFSFIYSERAEGSSSSARFEQATTNEMVEESVAVVEAEVVRGRVSENNRENVESIKVVREQMRADCDSKNGSDKKECQVRLDVATATRCEGVSDNASFKVCEKALEKISKNKCEDFEGDSKDYCERRVNAYGREYLVRERHELSEQCRGLNGQNRSDCQVTVNTQFKEEVKSRFQEGKEQNISKDKEVRVRAIVVEKHNESVQKIKQNSTGKQVSLLARLDAYVAQMDRWADKMDKLVQKAKEKGYGTTQLEFLVSDFRTSLDDARIYYDEEQYQDALASMDVAKDDVAAFKTSLRDLIKSTKDVNKSKSNKTEASE
jgi:hypothetical protein